MGGQTNRRQFLRWSAAAMAAAAAGCAGIGGDGGGDGGSGGDGGDGSDGSDGSGGGTATSTATSTPTEDGTTTEQTTTAEPVQPKPVRGSFPMFQYDTQNTGHNLNGTGPTEGVNEVWSYQSKVYVEAAPAVDGGIVYGGGSTEAFCLDASTGAVQWTRDLPGILNAVPAVDDGVVYMPKGGGTYALDTDDGSTVWRYEEMSGGSTSPVVDEDTVYVGGGEGDLYALARADSTLQWELDTAERPVTDPALADGTLFVGLVGQRSGISSLRAYDAKTGTELWRTPLQHRITAPTVRNGVVYVGIQETGGSGRVYALDAETGEERWFVKLSPVVTSLATDGVRLYVPTSNGLRGLSMKGERQWQADVGRPRGPATVVDDTVYVATDRLYALDAATGEVRFTHGSGASVRGPPAVLGGHVFVGTASGTVYGLQAENLE